jgi:hypothetical protein
MTNNMLFKSLALAVFTLFSLSAIQAQEAAPVKKVKPASKERLEAQEAKAGDDLDQELKLTPDQKAAFKKADDAYKSKAAASKDTKKEEQQRLREERIRAKKAVLTPEQTKKYDEILAQREARRNQKTGDRTERKAEIKDKKAASKRVKQTGNKQ